MIFLNFPNLLGFYFIETCALRQYKGWIVNNFKILDDMTARAIDNEAAFWLDIQHQYNEIVSFIDDVKIPELDEIERYKASITSKGLISSNLDERLEYNYVFMGGDVRREFLETCLSTLKNRKLNKSIFISIREKNLNADFFDEWSNFQRAYGGILSLVNTEEESKSKFNRDVNGQSNSIIQEYIYAYWMFPRWLESDLDRLDCEADLADAIHQALENQSLEKHEKEWLNGMIKYESELPFLKGKFPKFSKADIVGYKQRSAIKQSELPDIGC